MKVAVAVILAFTHGFSTLSQVYTIDSSVFLTTVTWYRVNETPVCPVTGGETNMVFLSGDLSGQTFPVTFADNGLCILQIDGNHPCSDCGTASVS